MTVTNTTLPLHSVLRDGGSHYDYVDSFQVTWQDEEDRMTPISLSKAFFSSAPDWVGHLFALRNSIVSLFGLKTPGAMANRQEQIANFKGEPGEQLGLFKVFSRNEQEVVMGEDDKHLDFRVSLFLEKNTHQPQQKNVTISTTVVFHNWLGHLYFLPVRPFHRLIVPAMLKALLREFEDPRSRR